MIGNSEASSEQLALSSKQKNKTAHGSRLTAHGFTLLELIIVISIIVILALIVLPRYQNAILHAKEATLKTDLQEMRKSLDQYAADKGQLPSSLEDLASAGYIREVPVDPLTGQKDWNIEMGDDPYLKANTPGVKNIHSSSGETSSEGTPYTEW